MYQRSLFVIFMLVIPTWTTRFTRDDEARCMSWVMKRLTGAEDITENTTNIVGPPRPLRDEVGNVGPHRPGKRGPVGPSGPRGLPGPPGHCECIPEEVVELRRENVDLKEKVQRIRQTSPETFCLLGMKARTIPNSGITVSSNSGYKHRSRLDDETSGWFPTANNPGHEWIMTDLGKIRPVTGVVTQGRHDANYFVKQFQVEHSRNGVNFTDVKKPDGSEMVFSGNTDHRTKIVNRFPKPVNTRFVRIYPMTFYNGMHIRFDVIDC